MKRPVRHPAPSELDSKLFALQISKFENILRALPQHQNYTPLSY